MNYIELKINLEQAVFFMNILKIFITVKRVKKS